MLVYLIIFHKFWTIFEYPTIVALLWHLWGIANTYLNSFSSGVGSCCKHFSQIYDVCGAKLFWVIKKYLTSWNFRAVSWLIEIIVKGQSLFCFDFLTDCHIQVCTLQMFTGIYRVFTGKSECGDFKFTGIACIPTILVIFEVNKKKCVDFLYIHFIKIFQISL